jgi:hypothetical protein
MVMAQGSRRRNPRCLAPNMLPPPFPSDIATEGVKLLLPIAPLLASRGRRKGVRRHLLRRKGRLAPERVRRAPEPRLLDLGEGHPSLPAWLAAEGTPA